MHPFWVLFVPAFAYQCIALAALVAYARTRRGSALAAPSYIPGISVLKPIRGLDPNTYEAFRSQAQQDYPSFELLFGVQDENDPAVPAIRQLQREFPDVAIRLVACKTQAANGKVGVLIDLAREARYSIWVVNDSDIRVTPEYLREIARPLRNPEIGVVTCPYRAYAHSSATRWEALGIATDFIPSTMVAQMLGVREFGLGSTLAFHADDLKAAGGFEALADYLADDYQLARRIAGLGKRAVLSSYVVETSLGEGSWKGVWLHQLRWARTIRASKGAAYTGLPITHAGLWALIAFACGVWIPALVLIAIRIVTAFTAGAILRSRLAMTLCWMGSLWDLYAFAVWLTCWMGKTVRWRDRVLQIGHDGRII